MATLSSIDSGLPFGDFRALIERLPPLDERAAARVRDDFGGIEKSTESLDRIEKVAAWLAASTGRPPAVLRPVVAIFAGNHGIARHDVSPRPVEATRRFVELAVAGGAGVNQACAASGFGNSGGHATGGANASRGGATGDRANCGTPGRDDCAGPPFAAGASFCT